MTEKQPSDFGYIPHGGQITAACICGCTRFDCFPQSMPADPAVWVHEYVCTKCGRYFGVTVVRD